MSELQTTTVSEVAASNNAASPNGMPEGMAPSGVNDAWREGWAALVRWFNRFHGLDNTRALLSTGGTSTAYTLTFTTAPASLFTSLTVGCKIHTTCGASPTLQVNALGSPEGIQKMTASGYADLAAGDLVTNQHAWFKRDGTLARWILMTPIAATATPAVDVQTFTGSGTWTKPAGTPLRVFVQAWGAGGSGGKRSTSAGGGGGGGGAYVEAWFPAASLGATETVTIGAGGPSQTTANTDGIVGGNTTLGSLLMAFGGGFGLGTAAAGGGGGGGALGAGVGGSGGLPRIVTTAGASADSGSAVGGSDGGGPGGNAANGGGSGGGGGSAASGNGGGSFAGGGGGGGGSSTTAGTGGTSKLGGAGSNGATGANNASAGTQPGGGGGGSETGNSGAGGGGKMIVTTFY